MAHCFSLGCRLQYLFLITVLPLVSKDKVKYTYNQFMACYANSPFFDQGCSHLAQLLLMVCKLQITYHLYGPGVKGSSDSVLQWYVFDRGASYFVE